MFGFGKSTLEKSTIEAVNTLFSAMGLPKAKAQAASVVDEVARELKARNWNPAHATQGDTWAEDEEFMAPRIAEGVTHEDVLFFWNRPLLLAYSEIKIIERIIAFEAEKAHAAGQDWKPALHKWARNTVRFGRPEPREGTLEMANRPQDTPVYPELSMRVNAWMERTTEDERARLLNVHGTMNAVVRALIKQKLL